MSADRIPTFAEVVPPRRGWKNGFSYSFVAHAIVFATLMIPAREPVLLSPQEKGGAKVLSTLVFYGNSDSSSAKRSDEHNNKAVARKAPKLKTPPAPAAAKPAPAEATSDSDKELTASLGPILDPSALFAGPGTHDIRIALPKVAPDPEVYPWEIPNGVSGQVIVEVTIDKTGKVVKTKVIKTIGYGLEHKVIAALMNWQFSPATIDSMPLASRQDVYFHFPR